MGRAAITTASETGLLALASIVVAVGQFAFGVLVWLVAVAAFWLNALVGLRGRRTLADRIAGTVVIRTGMYAKAAERTKAIARGTADAAAGVVEQARTVPREAVQRALTSSAGQQALAMGVIGVDRAREQVQTIGAAGAGKARQAGQQAQALGAVGVDRVREAGGRARRLWEQRRSQSQLPQEPSDPPPSP
jgi:hypothetical protein